MVCATRCSGEKERNFLELLEACIGEFLQVDDGGIGQLALELHHDVVPFTYVLYLIGQALLAEPLHADYFAALTLDDLRNGVAS